MNEQTIKEQFIRAVRLRAEKDLRPKKEKLALADRSLNHGGTAFQRFLPPCPAAPQRRSGVVPGDGIHARLHSKCWAVIEEKVRTFGHAVGKWVGIVHTGL